jgi:hypothetical protein
MRVRSLDARVVVERGIGGQAVRPPVGFQPLAEPAPGVWLGLDTPARCAFFVDWHLVL